MKIKLNEERILFPILPLSDCVIKAALIDLNRYKIITIKWPLISRLIKRSPTL